ncbi:MAG: hypothetical protein RML94_11745 [Bacteroidia bacterium]|nr:hypothetical protein [Bacteroidia bacterium]
MAVTTKPASSLSGDNILRNSYIEEIKSVQVGGFVASKVGHKITLTIQTTNVSNDTELYSYYDGSTLLMQIKIIYTNSTREIIQSVERVA